MSRQKAADLKAAVAELEAARTSYAADRTSLAEALAGFTAAYAPSLPAVNEEQHAARRAFEPTAERARGLIKQIDLLHKLAGRVASVAHDDAFADLLDRRGSARSLRQLEDHRRAAVEQLKATAYYHRQVAWLQDRFPTAAFQDVVGLVKAVTRDEIANADWSLTPGRYVGVAPPEVDEDFDFEQTIRDIHVELADLNAEAVELAARIQANLEELA